MLWQKQVRTAGSIKAHLEYKQELLVAYRYVHTYCLYVQVTHTFFEDVLPKLLANVPATIRISTQYVFAERQCSRKFLLEC